MKLNIFNHMKSMHSKLRSDPYLVSLLLITIIVKICILMMPFVAYHFFPAKPNIDFGHNQISLKQAYATFDAWLYMSIVDNGYQANDRVNAFYPLYPFLVRVFKIFFNNNTLVAGTVLSNLFSFIAIIFFYLFVKKLYSAKTAFFSGIFMLAFPTSFFLCRMYTESLFLMLIFIFFFYLYSNKFLPAVVAAFLLPLSRAQGILVIIPLIVFLVSMNIKNRTCKLNKNYLLVMAFLCGFAAYLFVMKFSTGAFFSGFDAQKYYITKHSISNLFNPIEWYDRNFVTMPFTLSGYISSVFDRFFFFFFLLLLYPIYKHLGITLFSYSLIMGLFPPLTSYFLMGYARFLLLVFPMYIILGAKLKEKHYVLTIPMICFQVLFLITHSLNYWAT